MPRTSYALKTFASSMRRSLGSAPSGVIHSPEQGRQEEGQMKAIAIVAAVAAATTATAAAAPPQGTQSNTSFAQSYAKRGVTSIAATAKKVSGYAPEVTTSDMPRCPGATRGEQTGGSATQDVSTPPMVVTDHSESDIRVDPTNTNHVIG